MKIRDIKEYVKRLCGEDTLALLGTNREALLQKIYGSDPSHDQVKSVICDAASFASNAEEQLFYEFVQNAYDASADSLYFYANTGYLIVLNNGEPFYTDLDIFASDRQPRDGQLYNFLAKGKSLKRSDNSKLGKYGQGSKLLYTLLSRVDDKVENEELLLEAVYKEKRGPYLISWNDQRQLNNLLFPKQTWEMAAADDYEHYPLLVKIVMSYYPIAPGTDEHLFADEEVRAALQAFDTLVDPRRNLNFLHRGTALIIPLGEGKYERIIADDNLQRVRTRLGGFASITKSQDRNAGKAVEHIYVMGKEIEQYDVESLFLDFRIDDKPFYYHFAFNPVFAEKNYVNLFKGLPILETKLRLGFIVDSQKFDVDSSRQRINDKEKTHKQLCEAFQQLTLELERTYAEDKKKFDVIYQSIIVSRPPEGEDSRYMRAAFRQALLPFLKQHILSSDHIYAPLDDIRTHTLGYTIPLDAWGITQYRWIDPEAEKHLRQHEITAQSMTLAEIVNDADADKLAAWIKSLTATDYAAWHDLVDQHKREAGMHQYKLLRTNRGRLVSLDELQSDAPVYYSIEPNMKWGEREHIGHCLTGISQVTYVGQLYGKVKAELPVLRATASATADGANLLAWIADKDKSYIYKIRHDIALLENVRGEYVPFCDLLAERPDATQLFDRFLPAALVPQAVRDRQWLLSPKADAGECWHWVVRHWTQLRDEEDWHACAHRHIADIKRVYKAAECPDGDPLPLFIGADGLPTTELHTVANNFSRLTQAEHNLLTKSVPEINFIPYDYQKELSEQPFRTERTSIQDIIGDGRTVDEPLLAVLIKLSDNYLRQYRTTETGGRYTITPLHGGHNYTDKVADDVRDELLCASFYSIPAAVLRRQKAEGASLRLVSNEELLIEALGGVPHPLTLLPLVSQANANVQDEFFRRLDPIVIDSDLDPKDIRWQLIEFAARSGHHTDVRRLIRHHGQPLPSSITERYVCVGTNRYDAYQLLDGLESDNRQIDSFLSCLPKPKGADFFKTHYYEGKVETPDTEDLYLTLIDAPLTVYQLRFCIDYAITNDYDEASLRLLDDEPLTEALDMVLEQKFEGFDNYFLIPGVDFDQQYYAPRELLTEAERLPREVQEWIDAHPQALPLFTLLHTVDDPFIAARQALMSDTVADDLSPFADPEKQNEVEAFIQWAMAQAFVYTYSTPRFEAMMTIIESLPSDYAPMPMLRYTGGVTMLQGEEVPVSHPSFMLELCDTDGSLLPIYAWSTDFGAYLQKSRTLQQFIKSHIVYVATNDRLLYKHRWEHRMPLWDIQTAAEDTAYPEYDNDTYSKWKLLPASQGITIHTSRRPVAMHFNIMHGSECVYTDKMTDSTVGYICPRKVIVQQPNSEQQSVMKAIAQHISSMEFFKEPFIALQQLYVDEQERIPDWQQQLEELKKKVAEQEEEERESQVRLTIGVIGELIYAQYLTMLGKDFDHAALRGVGEYDFEIKTDTTYVDVKTTLYSLKDGTAPFYLHRSQNEFIKQHPKAKYHIVRISLIDLNLRRAYERLRDTYGREANPMEDERLMRQCERVAQQYWKGAEIKTFDALSPEYAIRITQRVHKP